MLGTRRAFTSALAAAALVMGSGGFAHKAAAQGKYVVILAAASLKNALDEASAAWTRQTGKTTRISYAASSALARQIEGGIPADLFISADVPWMDYVAERKLIKPASRSNFLGNEIVLIAGKASRIDLKIDKGFNLRGALGNDGRLAMANVDAVPAGKYGKAALEFLGVWPSVSDRVAQAENVRMALTLVSRGEAPLGIVYKTDAASDPAVRIVGAFPAASHPAIIYPMALLASSSNPDAQAFVDFLKTPAAQPFFEKQGFTVLK
ncbi:MAG: molybdate ABC transporter substrate-binding protein [Rhodospirillales bacterium 24-66-33]|uniref:molybdate ABC transporter substrate-binding protein n=2 Tax=Reyranella sp. TaxID=1929291 RepID=UPI000BD8A1E5|nr:MAG: molybdate ABC transporter substrate-binding protein [Rhodospirillales bacterium 35-66-84]OYZ91535.1 MAG: molybdate ABC transporter substrate-binding protein [Rhodospirillales bacterium 24-66-33]OZB22072.1 MAG: molybdate ABC transporter substrate-binding protein [Rhodospirillales bacterium 39-66-50]